MPERVQHNAVRYSRRQFNQCFLETKKCFYFRLNLMTAKATLMKKYAKSGIAFLIMAAAAIYSGYHFRWPTNAPPITSFSVDLTQTGDQTVIVDLAAQPWPKYLLQPGRVRVSGQLNATGDLADRQTNLLITITSSSEKISARPNSRDLKETSNGYSYEITLNPQPKPGQGQNPKPKRGQGRGSGIPLSFELTIPYWDTIKCDIGSVIVQYIDNEQGSLQGQINFMIHNSRICKNNKKYKGQVL